MAKTEKVLPIGCIPWARQFHFLFIMQTVQFLNSGAILLPDVFINPLLLLFKPLLRVQAGARHVRRMPSSMYR